MLLAAFLRSLDLVFATKLRKTLGDDSGELVGGHTIQVTAIDPRLTPIKLRISSGIVERHYRARDTRFRPEPKFDLHRQRRNEKNRDCARLSHFFGQLPVSMLGRGGNKPESSRGHGVLEIVLVNDRLRNRHLLASRNIPVAVATQLFG